MRKILLVSIAALLLAQPASAKRPRSADDAEIVISCGICSGTAVVTSLSPSKGSIVMITDGDMDSTPIMGSCFPDKDLMTMGCVLQNIAHKSKEVFELSERSTEGAVYYSKETPTSIVIYYAGNTAALTLLAHIKMKSAPGYSAITKTCHCKTSVRSRSE